MSHRHVSIKYLHRIFFLIPPPHTLIAYYIFSGYPIQTKTGFVGPPSHRESQ